jgi:hypothetical protein
MKLKGVAALLAAVMAVPACGSDGPTESGPPEGFSAVGTWQLHVNEAANCWAAFDVRISVPQASLTPGANGTAAVLNSDGWWYLGGTGPDVKSTLSGTVNLTQATVALLLWEGASSARQGRFSGAATTATHISGTFSDPDGLFRTTADTHPCSSNAYADKD